MPSKAINDYQYDEDRKNLDITLVTGRTYRYFGVSQNVYEEFSVAESKGRFYNRYIRDGYKCVELTETSS
jgi:KTSC domain-containing protein